MSETQRIFFVDDDPRAGELLLRFTRSAPFTAEVFRDPQEALAAFRERGADLVVSDLRMPGLTGIELLQAVREIDPEVPFLIITGYANVDDAIEALRLGASDFIKKPFDMEELQRRIEHTLEHRALLAENRRLRAALAERGEALPGGMVGKAPAMAAIARRIDKIADIRCHVIIEGESGTGKELVARAIHQRSHFADTPFVVIDCGALSETLLESELFGHEKGAFTGATERRIGLLESARGGTVFLDEIGNISEAMQVRLLRVIQEQQITRVGGNTPIDIDARFIVATNRSLEAMVREGRFRADLYHRLNVVRFVLPPLRERREDIPALVRHFVARFARQYGRDVSGFDAASMRRLLAHDWPGNVRELQNLVERHVALADAPRLHLEELDDLRRPDDATAIDADLPSLDELERRYVRKLLARFCDNRGKTAETLGISSSTLYRKLKAWQDADGEAD